MSVDDLQELYSELRGSSAGPALMDARAFFLERQMQDAHAKLSESYETYKESRRRILRQDPEQQFEAKAPDRERQVRRLVRRQEKARDLLARFEDYLGQIERLAAKEVAREEAKVQRDSTPASEADSSDEVKQPSGIQTLKPTDVDVQYIKQFSQLIGDRQLDLINTRYDFKALDQVEDVVVDGVYLLRKGDRCFLLEAAVDQDDPAKLHCSDLANPKTRVILSPEQMVRLSQKRQVVLLLAREQG